MRPPQGRASRSERSGPPARTSWLHRDRGHFDQPLWSCERLDDHAGEAGMHPLQPVTEHAVDRLAVADVGQVDVAGDDVVQLRARLAEEKFYVVHDLAGLAGRVSDRNRLARLQVLGHLPTEIYGVAGHDRLAEVIGEPLLRVGIGS